MWPCWLAHFILFPSLPSLSDRHTSGPRFSGVAAEWCFGPLPAWLFPPCPLLPREELAFVPARFQLDGASSERPTFLTVCEGACRPYLTTPFISVVHLTSFLVCLFPLPVW